MGSRLWTQKEMDYLRENLGKIKTQDIAKRLNRTVCAIRERAWEMGISHQLDYTGDKALRAEVDKLNAHCKSRYWERRNQGLCTRCGKRFAEAGRAKCRPCREAAQAWNRENCMNDYLREYKTRQKAERRANHQCYNCGAKLPEGASGQCETCKKKQRERTNMNRLRMRIHGIPRSDCKKKEG